MGTSSLVTPPRWLVLRTVSPSPRPLSRLASLSHSWLCTPCATPVCSQTRSRSTRPTHGSSTPAGLALALPLVASVARSSTLVPSSTPSTAASSPMPSTRCTTSLTCPFPRAARVFLRSCLTPRTAGPHRRASRTRLTSWANCSTTTSPSTRTRQQKMSLPRGRLFHDFIFFFILVVFLCLL